jgi:hypothetical protein
MHNSEKREKLSTSQLGMVHHEKDCNVHLIYTTWVGLSQNHFTLYCPFKRRVLLIYLGFVYNYEY